MDLPEYITLISYEGKEFAVPSQILRVSAMLEQLPDYDEKVHLSSCGIDSDTLRLILSYCHHYRYDFPSFRSNKLVSSNLSEHLQDPWEGQFIEGLRVEVLLKVLEATTKLGIQHLQDLCCMRVATRAYTLFSAPPLTCAVAHAWVFPLK